MRGLDRFPALMGNECFPCLDALGVTCGSVRVDVDPGARDGQSSAEATAGGGRSGCPPGKAVGEAPLDNFPRSTVAVVLERETHAPKASFALLGEEKNDPEPTVSVLEAGGIISPEGTEDISSGGPLRADNDG